MSITRKAEYAIAVLVDLASRPDSEYVLSRDIARRERIPLNYIPQIVAQLTRKGWVEGMRGSGGGVRLAVNPEEISVAQVVEEVEGPIALSKCLVSDGFCEKLGACPLHQVWAKAQRQMVAVLAGTTIADLVKARRRLADSGGPQGGVPYGESQAAKLRPGHGGEPSSLD